MKIKYMCVCVCVKEMVVSAQRLLQYFQLQNKNSYDISRCIYNFLHYFKMVMYYSTISFRTHNDIVWNPKVPQNPV
jgi:hypothetical protein